jgi:hypothetical protein
MDSTTANILPKSGSMKKEWGLNIVKLFLFYSKALILRYG